jgi:hypothetical protein
MTAKDAMRLIVQHQEIPALNYAVNYAKAGLYMDENSRDFQVQCLYTANNIANWRPTKNSTVTKEEIQEARKALKREGTLVKN